MRKLIGHVLLSLLMAQAAQAAVCTTGYVRVFTMLGGSDQQTYTATHSIGLYGGSALIANESLTQGGLVPVDAVLEHFNACVQSSPGGTDKWTATLKINGTGSFLFCDIVGSATCCSVNVPVNVQAGDYLNVEYEEVGSAHNTRGAGWSVKASAIDADEICVPDLAQQHSWIGGGGRGQTFSASVGLFANNNAPASNPENGEKVPVAYAGRVYAMRCRVAAAPGSGKSWTCDLYRNNASTGLTCSISGTATECSVVPGTTCSRPFYAEGDQMAMRLTAVGGIPATTVESSWNVDYGESSCDPTVCGTPTPTGSPTPTTGGPTATPTPAGCTYPYAYAVIGGSYANSDSGSTFQKLWGPSDATEGNAAIGNCPLIVPAPVQRLYARTVNKPPAGTSWTVDLRKTAVGGSSSANVTDLSGCVIDHSSPSCNCCSLTCDACSTFQDAGGNPNQADRAHTKWTASGAVGGNGGYGWAAVLAVATPTNTPTSTFTSTPTATPTITTTPGAPTPTSPRMRNSGFIY